MEGYRGTHERKRRVEEMRAWMINQSYRVRHTRPAIINRRAWGRGASSARTTELSTETLSTRPWAVLAAALDACPLPAFWAGIDESTCGSVAGNVADI